MTINKLTFATGLMAVAALSFQKSKNVPSFIPLYSSQDGRREVVLINIDQITRIEPIYAAEDDDDPIRIDVYFEKDHLVHVFEPFKEFKDRLKDAKK